jgi:multidrug efflux pump subunit AcrA (membrane-fusion protein)
MDSEIGGVNTSVAQLQAQLDNANWELSQTAVRAPADGYVTVVALTVGDRALQARSAMSFIVEKEITLVGMFSQNGFQTIKEGAAIDIVFDNMPGRIYHAKVIAIPKGIGQGQIAASGTLARTNALGGTTVFPAELSVPEGISRDSLRLGDVRQRHRFCRQRRRDRPSRLDPCVGQFLYSVSLASRASIVSRELSVWQLQMRNRPQHLGVISDIGRAPYHGLIKGNFAWLECLFLALFGHAAPCDECRLSGVKRK